MNERIKSLIVDAENFADNAHLDKLSDGTDSDWHILMMGKFAELIVQECIKVGTMAFCSDNRVVSVFPITAIKEHFGVEQ